MKTIKESVAALDEGYNIVIFPEDSSDGYFAELKSFYRGFIVLAETYYRKKERNF